MEAALFTLDIVLLLLLMRGVREAERVSESERNLGLFSFLDAKTDQVQKGFGRGKGKGNA